MDAFDLIRTTLEDDGLTVRVEFREGTVDDFETANPGTRTRSVYETTSVAAVLSVRHWAPGGEVQGVREVGLEVKQGTLTPSALRRFAWERWLTAADAYARTGGKDVFDLAKAIQATAGERRRPGRRGHTPGFFEGIATEYQALRSKGQRNPVQQIAEEHTVSRNTAAGWVKQARALGHLPKARPNRAG